MKLLWQFLKWFGLLILILLVGLIAWVFFSFSGGQPYEFESGPPMFSKSELELFYSHPEPIGNVAASPDSNARVFFTD